MWETQLIYIYIYIYIYNRNFWSSHNFSRQHNIKKIIIKHKTIKPKPKKKKKKPKPKKTIINLSFRKRLSFSLSQSLALFIHQQKGLLFSLSVALSLHPSAKGSAFEPRSVSAPRCQGSHSSVWCVAFVLHGCRALWCGFMLLREASHNRVYGLGWTGWFLCKISVNWLMGNLLSVRYSC